MSKLSAWQYWRASASANQRLAMNNILSYQNSVLCAVVVANINKVHIHFLSTFRELVYISVANIFEQLNSIEYVHDDG